MTKISPHAHKTLENRFSKKRILRSMKQAGDQTQNAGHTTIAVVEEDHHMVVIDVDVENPTLPEQETYEHEMRTEERTLDQKNDTVFFCKEEEEDSADESWGSRLATFLRHYFWEGQLLQESSTRLSQQSGEEVNAENQDENMTFFQKHGRKLVALCLPAVVVHIIWWSIVMSQDLLYLFEQAPDGSDNPRYYMSITMIFGSMVAGATSEGGGAVAFPVMTLALGVSPAVARDFSFMIQSVGMVSSSFSILVMRLQLEWKALRYVTLGGIVGIIVGLEYVAPRLDPPYSKMYFVVIWSSFAIGLYLLNRHSGRTVFSKIHDWDKGIIWGRQTSQTKVEAVDEESSPPPLESCLQFMNLNWKRESLVAFGVLGGIFSSMAGSGIDICSFAALTLLFRVSEKVATPTSVLLMAINTTIGFAYRQFVMGGVEQEAWGFFAVCVPVVVVGSPVGAFLGSHLHRLTLAGIVYLIDAAQLVGALVVIQPWTHKKTDSPIHLTVTSAIMFIGGLVFFHLLSRFGLKLLQENNHVPKDPRRSSFLLSTT